MYNYLDSSEIINREYCELLWIPTCLGKGKNRRMFDHLTGRKKT
jgi:hypothetical protein